MKASPSRESLQSNGYRWGRFNQSPGRKHENYSHLCDYTSWRQSRGPCGGRDDIPGAPRRWWFIGCRATKQRVVTSTSGQQWGRIVLVSLSLTSLFRPPFVNSFGFVISKSYLRISIAFDQLPIPFFRGFQISPPPGSRLRGHWIYFLQI